MFAFLKKKKNNRKTAFDEKKTLLPFISFVICQSLSIENQIALLKTCGKSPKYDNKCDKFGVISLSRE